MKDLAILIPARYNSTRFPGKMLEIFDGIPLVRRVYNTCVSTGIDTYVLTDDERIAAASPNSIMTSKECENGTARCADIVERLSYRSFINVQGDMIDVNQSMIEKIVDKLPHSRMYYSVVTLHSKMNEEDQKNPNVVKLVHTNDCAHWFCRSSLQYGSRHIGIYGYDSQSLKKYKELKVHNEETIESLEQLRWIQNGAQIASYEVDFDGIEINTPEDAYLWRKVHDRKPQT
jgi:3-deoxy-manno-octulosonate cytidylyltransferase (CMP-KDO synthetase)